MNKKDYQQPALRVVKLQQQHSLLLETSITTINGGDTGIGFGGGGTGPALAPELGGDLTEMQHLLFD